MSRGSIPPGSSKTQIKERDVKMMLTYVIGFGLTAIYFIVCVERNTETFIKIGKGPVILSAVLCSIVWPLFWVYAILKNIF